MGGIVKYDGNEQLLMRPIGTIKKSRYGRQILIDEQYRPALHRLDDFSHLWVIWYAGAFDERIGTVPSRVHPFYAKKTEAGIFATRSPIRFNSICMTACRLIELDEEEGIVVVNGIDAFEGTAVLDLKAYFPCVDRVREPVTPAWIEEKMDEWYSEEGVE